MVIPMSRAKSLQMNDPQTQESEVLVSALKSHMKAVAGIYS